MTKKPAPKKPAAKMPKRSVEDIMQELDAAVSDEEGGETITAAPSPAPPAAKPSRPPHNLQTMKIIYPDFDHHPALQSYAGRFLDACFAVIDNPRDRANFRDVKKHLTALSLDDPGWLDQIREAIVDSGFEPEEKHAILSVFEMATLLLYDSVTAAHIGAGFPKLSELAGSSRCHRIEK